MKNFKKISAALLKVFLCVALACPFAVSCYDEYDDTELREKIDLIIEQIYDLEERLNGEIKAIQDLLSGKILVTSVQTDAATGITEVVLSNGSKLQLHPQKDLKSYVTYITLSDGVDYWAFINDKGQKELFLDKTGQPVPVVGDTPEVIVKDDETFIVIGGVEYPMSGNSVFSDYELITDELTGEVYAVTFTFGEDMTFTVTVDGACGFWFVMRAGWDTEIISDYFVPLGQTSRVQLDARGVVDYVLQIPDGWRVKEFHDENMGVKFFDITAPAKTLVESGVAAADGELKVVAVLEGGKATVAKLYLSSAPFKQFSVSMGNADVVKYNGLQKYVYGICKSSEYDEETIFPVAEELLTAYNYPAGYGVTTFDLIGEPLSKVAGADLTPGEKYMFWAIPALYFETDADAGYYLEPGTFVNTEVVYSSVKFQVGEESYKDAQLSMELKGVESYYTGVVKKEDFMVDDVLYRLNFPGGYYTPKTTPMTYEGSVFTFAGVTGEPATEYVAWLAVAEEGREYKEADVVLCEFSTLNLTPGSTVQISASEVTPTDIEITAQLTATGAEGIYYAYLTKSTASKYADDTAKANYLFQYGRTVKAETAEAKASHTISKVAPETEYVLFAVATDKDGKYSNVLAESYTTLAIAYNDLKVELGVVRNDPGDVILSISSEGAVEYLYWVGKTSDNTWKSSSYLGGSAATAQEYLYLNQDATRIASVMAKYPVVDGQIKLEDLSTKVEHVIVAMAKDSEGKFSQAVEYRFVTNAIAIGQVVLSTDPKWAAATPVIEWIPESFHKASGQALDGTYAYYFSCGTEFTAYVMSGAEGYFSSTVEYEDISVEEKIFTIVEQSDKVRDYEILYDENLWETEGYPAGHYLYHAPHGCPTFGYAVIFSKDSEANHADHCSRPDNCIEYTGGVYGTRVLDLYYNTGEPIHFRVPGAFTTDDTDKVFVALKDKDGNFYEPYYIDVPDEYFNKTATE